MKEKSNRRIKIILSGGGSDIEKIIRGIGQKGTFKKRSVAYVIIAAEENKHLLSLIKANFGKLEDLLCSLGASRVSLIESSQADQMYDYEIIVFSGGDTSRLLNFLRRENFVKKYSSTPTIKTLVGISAGAIVLAKQGVGTIEKEEHVFEGLGLIEKMVVPHSNRDKKERYPGALHLQDYEFVTLRVN